MSNIKHKLIVEGRNDQYVMQSILRQRNISCVILDRKRGGAIQENTISLEQQGGFNNLHKKLFIKLKDPQIEKVGIIVDADDPDDPKVNISNRWQSLKGVLNRFDGVSLPDDPSPSGTITTLQRGELAPIVVGIWIMPDNQSPGTLEDFVKHLVPSERTALWRRAEGCVDEIPDDERLFRAIDTPKVDLHTWLAWQKTPGIPLGAAISQRYLDADTPHGQQLIDWIRRLFEI